MSAALQKSSTANVYKSHHLFLVLAVALTLIAVLIVMATYHGFWRCGRSVTWNLLETAKAFNAPLLLEEDSYAGIKQLVRAVDGMPVGYGAVTGSLACASQGLV